MNGYRHLIAAGLGAALAHGTASADSLNYDAETGNYVLNYQCEGAEPITTTLEPHNKIAPSIESAFSETREGVSYGYAMSLGAGSRQPLHMVVMDPILPVTGVAPPPTMAMMQNASAEDLRKFRESIVASAPAGWMLIHFANRNGTARVGWGRSEQGLSTFAAGSNQKGFGFSSQHLPGVFAAAFHGDGEGWALPCEGPAPGGVADALETLRRNDYVPRYVAAPVIRIDEPFNPMAVLTAVRDHADGLEQRELLDASAAEKVRAHISTALSALADGDSVRALVALRTLRGDLHRKQPAAKAKAPQVPRAPVDDMKRMNSDYDRELAIRVLDFDVAYVAGRLTGKP